MEHRYDELDRLVSAIRRASAEAQGVPVPSSRERRLRRALRQQCGHQVARHSLVWVDDSGVRHSLYHPRKGGK